MRGGVREAREMPHILEGKAEISKGTWEKGNLVKFNELPPSGSCVACLTADRRGGETWNFVNKSGCCRERNERQRERKRRERRERGETRGRERRTGGDLSLDGQ